MKRYPLGPFAIQVVDTLYRHPDLTPSELRKRLIAIAGYNVTLGNVYQCLASLTHRGEVIFNQPEGSRSKVYRLNPAEFDLSPDESDHSGATIQHG